MEEANIRQKSEFAEENRKRVTAEIERCDAQVEELSTEVASAKEDAEKKKQDIEEIRQTILASDTEYARLEKELEEKTKQKEQMAAEHKGFFRKEKKSLTAWVA